MMVIAFRFRFQRLLDVRQAVERQRMMALSAEMARHEEALADLKLWQSRLEQSEQALRRLYRGRPMVTEAVQREHAHRQALQARVLEAEEQVKEAEQRVEQARMELLDAAKQRRVMELLRERHEAAYWAEQDRREQAALDEIGLRLAERRMPQGEDQARRGESIGA